MELLEFVQSNPKIVETAKNCKTQNDLHKLLVDNKINLNDISEDELFKVVQKMQKQNKQVADELLENVAGGVSNAKQRKLQNFVKEKVDPSTIKGNLAENGVTLSDMINACIENGDNLDNYYESDGKYFRLN